MFLLASFLYFMDQVPENPEANNVANDPAPPNAAAPVAHKVSFLAEGKIWSRTIQKLLDLQK